MKMNSAYQSMSLLVFLHSTGSPSAGRKFRRLLAREGFRRDLPAVYSRYCGAVANAMARVEKLRTEAPPGMHARAILITDKQLEPQQVIWGPALPPDGGRV